MSLSIGFSPCPNDTYIFYALVHGAIDTGGLDFHPLLADVQELNEMALHGQLDITKISFHAFRQLTDQYVLLDSGSALGNDCGPILIAAEALRPEDLDGKRVAIPGEHTTAHFLLDYFLPVSVEKHFMLFSEIEPAVAAGEVDAGVIIHENRFTFRDRGLVEVQDLGAYWEQKSGHPIPLGGILGHRRLPHDVLTKVEKLIRQSIEYAHQHPEEVIPYVRQYAQEMTEPVMWQHIRLYVNPYSLSLGDKGRRAIQYFLRHGNAVSAGKPFLSH